MTHEQYAAALSMIAKTMIARPDAGSPQEIALRKLIEIVEKYEGWNPEPRGPLGWYYDKINPMKANTP